MKRQPLFTHICDPNGHPLVEEIQDHDDDKVDAGGGDRRGQLWGDEPTHHLDPPHGVFDDTSKRSINSQSVCNDPDNTGHDQRNLHRKKKQLTLLTQVNMAILLPKLMV